MHDLCCVILAAEEADAFLADIAKENWLWKLLGAEHFASKSPPKKFPILCKLFIVGTFFFAESCSEVEVFQPGESSVKFLEQRHLGGDLKIIWGRAACCCQEYPAVEHPEEYAESLVDLRNEVERREVPENQAQAPGKLFHSGLGVYYKATEEERATAAAFGFKTAAVFSQRETSRARLPAWDV
eukprot:s841_g2.t1